jgi:hypothetical protein
LPAAGTASGLPLPAVGRPPLLGASLPKSLLPSTPSLPTAPLPSTPSLPGAPLPGTPSLPSTPLPSTPALPRLPATPAPTLPAAPSLPGGPAAPAGTRGRARSTPTPGGGSGHSGSSADPRGSRARTASHPTASHHRAVRERRFRRKVRALAGCLGAVSGLERRVLELRAGLNGAAPHSRSYTAKRLRISARRAAIAERRGLRRLESANRSSGCAAPARGGSATHSAGTATAVPVLAGILGSAVADRGGVEAAQAHGGTPRSSAAAGGSAQAPLAAGTGTQAASAEGSSGASPLLAVLLALAAATVLLAAILPGRRLAMDALDRRHERSVERRQRRLVADIHGILGERD